MKKEASGKKSKWLWLILGLVVLLAVAGVVLALVLGGRDDATASGRPDLYWNVDKNDHVDPNTGLSTRAPAEDGNFYIRFAHDGEQVEIPVADKKLVNYIDSLDVMGLTLDDAGFVVDIFQPKEVATVIGEGLYVQTAGANGITVNSSIMMNGRKVVIELSEDLKIYDVSGKGEFVGQMVEAESLTAMDSVSIYGTLIPEGSDEEAVITHVFVTKKPAESAVYWRANQYYASKKTTRVPDENGVYTIPFYCDGESVELKCKDEALVTQIDSVNRYYCHFGLEFDEEGYIIGILDSFIGSRTLLQCERYDITSISADGSYVATSLIKNDGAFVEGVLGEDCPIYDVSYTAVAEHQANRKVDSLKLGDRVCIWTDTTGNPVLIYVTTRIVDSPAYWNVTRKYDSTTKTTSREPNANGYYEVELLKAGDTEPEIYYLKTEEDATEIDYTTDRCVGLKVGEGNVVEYVYNMECIFGYGYFCRGYYVTDATAAVCTFLSSAGSGYTMNGVLAADCKVWNVSTYGQYGAETTLQYGDSVYAACKPTGEIINAYVTRRTLGEDTMYWRLSAREYDSVNKVTTRTPDADGYYVYLFAHKGKQVTLKTKDKDIASYLDSLGTPAVALIVKNGIIQEAHDGLYAAGGFRYSGWYVREFTDTTATIYTMAGREETWDLAENVQIYNVSNSFKDYKGEKTTLQINDYVYVFYDINSDIAFFYVWGRETSKMAWPVAPQYDSTNACTTREPDANGWYYIDLAVDGKVKTYKTKNKDIVSGIDSYITALGIETSGDVITYYSPVAYVENVKGADVTNVTVSAVNGKDITTLTTVGSEENVGTKKTITLASNVKIYDVSADAQKFGAATKLKVGDKIYTYTDNDGQIIYVFVVAHSTRQGGYMSLCDHCNEVVYWNPYHASANVTAYDCHYYLASDIAVSAQLRVYSNARDFETVLDLNGHTLTRDGGRASLVRYGDTLTVIDSVGGGKIQTSGYCANGAVFMVSDGTLNLHGGTLSHISGDNPEDWSYAGGLIICNSNAVVNMYGGTLANGEVFADKSHEAYGGAIRLTSSTFNMYGGLITGGKAHSITFTTADGQEKTNGGFGGNIYAEKESTVNVYGGTIENGAADSRGGNIYSITGSTVNITDGTVSGGIVGDRGGNIFNSASTVNISGGAVVDGTTTGRFGGNIMSQGQDGYINISGGKVTGGAVTAEKNTSGGNICLMYSNLMVTGGEISGGSAIYGGNICASESGGRGSSVTITGGVIKGTGSSIHCSSSLSGITITGGTLEGLTNVSNVADFTVSGKPVITDLTLGDAVLLTLDKMEQGAKITVNKLGVFTKPTENADTYKNYFVAADNTMRIVVSADKALKVSHPDAVMAYCPHCEGEAEWMPWDGETVASGHYFAEDDITLAAQLKISGGANVVLDLKGRTVTAAEDSRAFAVYSTLSVMDSVGGGSITGGRAVEARGGNIYVEGGTFNLYSGAITNGVSDTGHGGNVYATTSGIINIMGGTISGGSGKNADNVYAMYSTLNISGGEIIGSDTGAVPNVAAMGYNGKIAYVNISGGKLTGSAINLRVTGALAEVGISGGVVTGQATISGVAKLDVSGKPDFENLQLGETTVMTVGELAEGASIVINKIGTFTAAFASETAAEAMLNSGCFAPYGEGETLGVTDGFELEVIGRPVNTISRKCEKCGEAVEFTSWYGTAINVSGHYFLDGEVTLTDAVTIASGLDVTIDLNGFALNAAAGKRAFNIEGELTIQDSSENETGKIQGSTVAAEGATLYVNKGKFNLYSGTVTGGTADGNKYGGNMCVLGNAAQVNLYGGTVSNGTAARGGNMYIYSGKVTISGDAQVLDGEALAPVSNAGRAGNIYITGQNAYLTVTDNAVVSGGHSEKDGGNIYAMYAKNVTVSGNAVVKDGSAVGSGDNMIISGTDAGGATELIVSGGTISGGDISLSGSGNGASVVTVSGGTFDSLVNASSVASLTVSGAPVMENLKLGEGEVITVGALTDGASIKINATGGVFTGELADAAAVADYFDAVDGGYNAAVTADGKYLEIVTDSTVGGEECPHCDSAVWTEWDGTTVTSGHYYLTVQVDITGAQLEIAADADVVIDLRGNTITATDVRAFYVTGKLSIVDTVGGGKVIGTGALDEATSGGVFVATSGGTLSLYSGELSMAEENNGAMRGGVIYVGASSYFNMYGGAVRNGVADGDASKTSALDKCGRGGNICNLGGTLNLEGGVIDGGKAGYAGNIYNGASDTATTNISGTVLISNGTAVAGNAGNLYLERGILNISGGTMTGGKASGIGSNILMTHTTKADLTITGGTLEGETRLGTLSKFALSGNPVIENLQLANITVITELGTLTAGASIGVSKVGTTNLVFTGVLDNAADVVGYFHGADVDKTVAVDAENKLTIADACPCGCKTPVDEVVWVDPATFFASNGATISGDVHIRLNDDFNVTEAFNNTATQIVIGASNGSVRANVVIDLNGKTWTSNRRILNYRNCVLTILDSSAEGTGTIISSGGSTALHGGVIATYGTVNLYSGTLTQPAGGSLVSRGGVIYQNQGVFNMYGGAIIGGTAITDATHDAIGGNIYMYSGTFNLYGGTISGGTAMTGTNPGRGGNVYVKYDGTFNVYGGTITGGTADEGADIYLEIGTTTGAALNAAGGEITGQVYAPSALATVSVSGNAKLGNVTLMEDALVRVGALYSTAKIAVNKTSEFTDVLANAESYLPYFTGIGEFDTVAVTAEKKLIVVEGCPCGCGALASEVTWVDPMTYFTESGALAATTTHCYITEDVHLRLNGDFDVTEAFGKAKQIIVGKSAEPAVVALDLNGWTWSSNNRFYVEAGSEATVIDTSAEQDGVMTSTGNGNPGRVVINNGIFNLRGGTLTITEEGLAAAAKGGVVYNSKGTFNMYGGTIIGGKVNTDGTGGNVAANAGTVNLYGGTITGGEAATGYNVYLEKGVTLNLDGCNVVGNEGDDTNGIYQAS